jgi:hypothetical protein
MSKPKQSASAVLKEMRALTGIAYTDEHGSIVDQAGTFDADTFGAVGVVASGQLEALSETLAAGRLTRWYAATETSTLWVHRQGAGILVGVGPAAKNPEPVSAALAKRT